MNWKDILKDTATATSTAEDFLYNDEPMYIWWTEKIKMLAEDGKTGEQIKQILVEELPEMMAHNKNFMKYLTGGNPSDALHDVDWKKIVDGMEDDIAEFGLARNR